MASYKCWKCGELYDYKQSLACHMKHKHSEEDNGYDADTDDDDNDNNSKDIKKKNNTNLSIMMVWDISVGINMDNELLTRSLTHHIIQKKHSQIE